MSSSLLLSREQVESYPDLKYKQAVFHHTAVSGLQGEEEEENELKPEELCPPLSRLEPLYRYGISHDCVQILLR